MTTTHDKTQSQKTPDAPSTRRKEMPPREAAAIELRSALMEDRGRGISGKTWVKVEAALKVYRAHLTPAQARRLDRYFDMESEREFTHEGADRLIARLESEHRKGQPAAAAPKPGAGGDGAGAAAPRVPEDSTLGRANALRAAYAAVAEARIEVINAEATGGDATGPRAALRTAEASAEAAADALRDHLEKEAGEGGE